MTNKNNHSKRVYRYLHFGDPKEGALYCVQIAYKPNRLQRYLLRKLLALYYFEQEF